MELETHQTAFHYDKDNLQHLALDKQLWQKLFYLKSAARLFFAQKLKCFFKDCDKGSSFFHSLMSQRHRKNFIPVIQLSNGSLTTSIDEVEDTFVCYFRDLLGSSESTLPLDVAVSWSGPCIDLASHASLLALITYDVIKQALFSLDDNKASKLDGYTSLFFKKSWDIVDSDFYHVVHDFFVSRKLLKQINHSIIALIPKSANVTSTADFRPISYCNMVYKVISKILSARLVIALAYIISPLQNAFLGDRVMANNIHIIQELLWLYERKHVSPRCLMKVDLKKAFDSVQWPFLQQLLLSFGFPNRFMHLIMQCVETSSFSIVVNDNIYGFFQGKNRVRQGDPLSPYLFISCMEYLSRMLKMAYMNFYFRFHPKCRPLGISHLAFADDIILLSRGDRQSVACLYQQLISFGHISDLAINREKSFIYFGGVGE